VTPASPSEQVVVAIGGGGPLDVLAHPGSRKHPNQRLLVVAWDGYVYLGAGMPDNAVNRTGDSRLHPESPAGYLER
jgi:hypothetical protein